MKLHVKVRVTKGGGRDQLARELQMALSLGWIRVNPGLYDITIKSAEPEEERAGAFRGAGPKVHYGALHAPTTPDGGRKVRATCGAAFVEPEVAWVEDVVDCPACIRTAFDY